MAKAKTAKPKAAAKAKAAVPKAAASGAKPKFGSAQWNAKYGIKPKGK